MIKDIIVNLGVGQGAHPAGDYAVSVASAFEAHVAGIAFVYDPNVPASSATAYIPVEAIDALRHENEVAAKAAIDYFAKATSRAGVPAEPLLRSANFAVAGDWFGRIARRFDLAIVEQVKPESSAGEQKIAESALFDSGRPVIFVPYIQKTPLKLDRVMVCWDGSRPAVRAIADAMPLFERAATIEVVIVSNERGKDYEIEGADMGQHLARHGLNVEVRRIVRNDLDVANTLLSYAADAGVDFMVMGGYGHSRLREFILGGVTRSILRSMVVPVLMSH